LNETFWLPGVASGAVQRSPAVRREPALGTMEGEMRNTQAKDMVVAGAVALIIAMSSSWITHAAGENDRSERQRGGAAAAGRGPDEQWNTFSARVTIRRGVIGADHQPLADRTPPVSYHWERSQSGSRWKTTMTFMGATRPEITGPSGAAQSLPPVIVRIEDDGDGEGPRFVTRQGVIVRPPSAADRRKLSADDTLFEKTDALLRASGAAPIPGLKVADTGRNWIDAVVLSAARKPERRGALQRRFAAAGSLRGMSRYVERSGAKTTELLVDSEWSAVQEINLLEDGALQMHGTFSYEPGPGGALVRRAVHVEQSLSAGQRSSLVVELASVRLEDRR
jgi:hypothetical protein